MKWLSLFLTLIFMSACSQKPTTPTTTSQNLISSQTQGSSHSQETTTTNTTTSYSSESRSEVSPIQTRANLVGTWQQDGQKLQVDALGNWQLIGKINSSGHLTVAADFDQTKMVKLYGFNSNIDGIGTYFIANFNSDSSKMNFGYLGTFTRISQIDNSLTPDIYQANYLTKSIDFSNNIIGTWTLTEGTEFRNTHNFNPDGSIDTYSDGRGEASFGRYSVKYLENNKIALTITYDESADSSTSIYTVKDGIMREDGFEDYKWTRNTIPSFPE